MSNPWEDYGHVIAPDVQADREAKRLALLKEEQQANPDDPNITKEIQKNRPVQVKNYTAPTSEDGPWNSFQSPTAEAGGAPWEDFKPQKEGFRAWNKMLDASKHTISSDWINEDLSMKDIPRAAGALAGLPVGFAEFFAHVGQQAGRMGGIVIDSDKWSLKKALEILEKPTVANEFQKWREENMPNFSQGMEIPNLPFAIAGEGLHGLASQGVEMAGGSPEAGKLSEHVLDVVLGALGARAAFRPKAKIEPKNTELKDLVDAKDPNEINRDAYDKKIQEQIQNGAFEWDKSAARDEQPLGDIQKTTRNPNPIEEGLPRPMDKEGNLKPTKYDQIKDDTVSREPLEQELADHKAGQEDAAWEQRKTEQEAQQKAQYAEDQARNAPLDDAWEPSQGSTPREPINRPISNRSPMSRQRGAVDISDLVGEPKGSEGSLPMALLRRLRGLFGEQASPNVDSLKYLREKMEGGKLPNPDDKPVIVLTDKGAAIYDGNHRIKVADELGWSKMDVVIKDYTTKNRYDGRSEATKEADRATQKPLGQTKFGKGQRGAIDFKALFGSKEEAENFNKAKAIVGRVDRPVEEHMKMFPPPTEDIKHRFGGASGPWRVKRELSENMKNAEHGIHTLSYLEDSMHLLKEKFERFISEQMHPAVLAIRDTYTDLTSRVGIKTLRQDFATVKQMEKSPETWFDGKNYVPTVDQLKAAGMSEKSAKTWNEYHKAIDALWPHIEQFATDKGIHVPDRVPGYLPHFTMGAWKVQLWTEVPQKDGSVRKSYLATVGAKTAGEADRIQRLLEQYALGQGLDKKVKVGQLKPGTGNDTFTMLAGFFETQDRMQMNKGLHSLIEKAFEQASIGQLKNAMERKANPQILHQLDRIVSGDEFQLSPKEARDAVKKMTEILEFVPTMNMRAEFLTKTLFPLVEAGYFKNRPNLRDAMLDYVGQFIRVPDTASAFLDKHVKDFFVRKGWDPALAQDIVGKANGLAAAWYLMFKPSFWAVQMTQKVANQGLLWTMAAEQRMMGDKVGSPVSAIVKGLAPSRFQKLSNGESLLEYAEKVGASNAYYVENLRGSAFVDPVAKAIEKQTRTSAFQTAYNFLRQTMSEKEALDGATRISKEMNVDYSQELGKPTWFNKEGAFMKPIFLFAQYPLHQLQMITYQASVLGKAGRAGELRAAGSALTGLAYNLSMMGAIGGLAGFPLISQLSQWAQKINETYATDLPTVTDAARHIGQGLRDHDFGDDFANFVARTAEFGLYSQILGGYDVSGSARGPTIQAPDAFPHFLHTLWDLGVLTTKALQPYGISEKEMMEEGVRNAPSILREATMRYIKNGYDINATVDNVSKLVSGKIKENAPMQSDMNLPGDYERTDRDQAMAMIGLKSLGEQSFNHTETLDAQKTRVMDKVNDRIIQQFKEHPEKSDKFIPFLQEMAKVGDGTISQGRDIGTVLDEVIQYQMKRRLTETERRAMGLSSMRSLGDWQRWKKEILQQVVK